MIDFTKYTLQELRAIASVMDDLMMNDAELSSWDFSCYVRATARESFRAESAAIEQQAREASDIDANNYKAAKTQLSSIYGTCVAEADPPAAADPPDMFGWVGDALDDLCAAGEVMGK